MLDAQILQFNCGLTNYKATKLILDAADLNTHQVMAIQKQTFNRHTDFTYCLWGYCLADSSDAVFKVCFMISRKISVHTWFCQSYSQNVTALHLHHTKDMTIINVYNSRSNEPQIQTWQTIQQVIHETEGEIILLRDFNAHHLSWGGPQAICEAQSEHLWTATIMSDLSLLTPCGLPTWKRGTQQSIIDLTFASEAIKELVQFCGPMDHWATMQNHILIDIQITVLTEKPVPSKWYVLKKLDKDEITQHLCQSEWTYALCSLTALQQTIQKELEKHCPKARPSAQANPQWSSRALELLVGVRWARWQYNDTGAKHDRTFYQSFQSLLKKELRRVGRANWRRFIEQLTSDSDNPHEKGLWRLLWWSKLHTGKPQASSHISFLHRSDQEDTHDNNPTKAQILAGKFFSEGGQANLSNINNEMPANHMLNISSTISAEQIEQAIHRLPNGKVPGPDNISNEVLKMVASLIKKDLTQAISKCFIKGVTPRSFQESTTVVLQKKRKKNYFLPSSYRPITLKNTIAKLMEKLVTERIADATEVHGLLPWNQMGARRQRSTLTVLELLTSCVNTVWKAKPECVVSMLSLDLGGAFDNVSHERLLHIMWIAGFPPWIIHAIGCFLNKCRTRIVFLGFKSDWIHTSSGIPQESPLSPILFLFFISELLATFERPEDETMAFGFVDDTNLVTWGTSAQANCHRLESAHSWCIAWAKRHGARFAPDKYQLIHFTRWWRDPNGDLMSTVCFNDQEIPMKTTIQVLGIQVDSKLRWKEHVQQVIQKDNMAFEALSRITASTWDPFMKQSWLLYTAVVRPAILYGSQVWGMQDDGAPPAVSLIRSLMCLQNRCLRKIMGAYKRTPTTALKCKSNIPSVDLHMEHKAMNGTVKTASHPVTTKIKQVMNTVWTSLQCSNREMLTRHRHNANPTLRPTTAGEGAQRWALAWAEKQAQRQSEEQSVGLLKALDRWTNLEWKCRWTHKVGQQKATIWKTDWMLSAHQLYENLHKHEATALFLFHTEVLGLNVWLASVKVSDVDKRCPCGWSAQTVRHILLFCPTHTDSRALYFWRAGLADLHSALSTTASAHQAVWWLVASGLLGQFSLAKEIVQENTLGYNNLARLDDWTTVQWIRLGSMNQGGFNELGWVQGTRRDHPLISESKCSKGRQCIDHRRTQKTMTTHQCHASEAPAGQN